MDALGPAAEALERARDALRLVDLDAAALALAEHDRHLRQAVASGAVAVTELEFLGAEQARLLTELQAVREGVQRQLAEAGRSHAVARAYLGNAGG